MSSSRPGHRSDHFTRKRVLFCPNCPRMPEVPSTGRDVSFSDMASYSQRRWNSIYQVHYMLTKMKRTIFPAVPRADLVRAGLSSRLDWAIVRSGNLGPLQPALRCDLEGCGCRYTPFIWISHSLEAIYFEVPKSASSSFKGHFDLSLNHSIRAFALAFQECRKKSLASTSRFAAHLRYGKEFRSARKDISDGSRSPRNCSGDMFEALFMTPDEAVAAYPGYMTFTIVRDPVDRILSCWSMFCRSGMLLRERQIENLFGQEAVTIDIRTFVYSLDLHPNHHWNPMHSFVPRKGVDEILRLETLEEDTSRLGSRLGIKLPLGVVNRSARERLTLSREITEKLNFYCSRDQEIFAYSPAG